MKALIIGQVLATPEQVKKWEGTFARSLFIEEKDGLIITLFDGKIYASFDEDVLSETHTLQFEEVEVPDELVERAYVYVKARREFLEIKDQFAEFLVVEED